MRGNRFAVLIPLLLVPRAFRVNTITYLSQRAPSVASDSAGNFLVTWHGDDGDFDGVFGQRYGGIFPVELMHFRVE